MKDELLALAEQVQTLHFENSNFDIQIALASGQYVLERRGKDRDKWFYNVSHEYRRYNKWDLPSYTGLIDVAVTLVPRDWEWAVGWERPMNGGAWADVQPNHAGIRRTWAATPALALTTAALRARATIADAG